jgi:hypothetical protein
MPEAYDRCYAGFCCWSWDDYDPSGCDKVAHLFRLSEAVGTKVKAGSPMNRVNTASSLPEEESPWSLARRTSSPV